MLLVKRYFITDLVWLIIFIAGILGIKIWIDLIIKNSFPSNIIPYCSSVQYLNFIVEIFPLLFLILFFYFNFRSSKSFPKSIIAYFRVILLAIPVSIAYWFVDLIHNLFLYAKGISNTFFLRSDVIIFLLLTALAILFYIFLLRYTIEFGKKKTMLLKRFLIILIYLITICMFFLSYILFDFFTCW